MSYLPELDRSDRRYAGLLRSICRIYRRLVAVNLDTDLNRISPPLLSMLLVLELVLVLVLLVLVLVLLLLLLLVLLGRGLV